MAKVYFDVESAGLKGDLHLIQYSIDRGPIKILRLSRKPDLCEFFRLLDDPEKVFYGFNVGFDIWKIVRKFRPEIPWNARFIDLYQHTLKAKPLCYYPLVGGKAVVKIRKIPMKYVTPICQMIGPEIKRILPPIAKVKAVAHKEDIVDGENGISDYAPYTIDFTVKVPKKLKELVKLFLSPEEAEKILNFEEVMLRPSDMGWKEDSRFPVVMPHEEAQYQELWEANEAILDDPVKGPLALRYSSDDVRYLWLLEDWLRSYGNVIEEDDDDVCTRVVAEMKARGCPVDQGRARELSARFQDEMDALTADVGIDLESPKERLKLLKSHALLPDLVTSSSADTLKILVEEKDAGILTDEGIRIAEEIRKFKPLAQRKKQLETLIQGDGNIYPDFVVLGTSTQRMRGTGGINWQGVAQDGEIRECVLTSMAGDFDGLEWMIAASVYQDAEMLRGIREGIDPHTMATKLVFEEYRDSPIGDLMVMKKEKEPRFTGKRKVAKTINFAVMYGAGPFKIGQNLGIPPEEAEILMNDHYFAHYQSLGETRKELARQFCTADFEKWSKGSVGKMADHVVGIYGDVRYICFERFMADWLWKNSNNLAAIADGDDTTVVRRVEKGRQKVGQSIKSAALGAASGIQKAVMRQLGNFVIQNAGARLTKKLMRVLWEKHRIWSVNIHDELWMPRNCPAKFKDVRKTVDAFLVEHRGYIEGLSMDFKPAKTWAEK